MKEFPGLVDSHLHLLSMERKGLDPQGALEDFFACGGLWALDVAVDTLEWDRRVAWAEAEPRLWLSAGIHPSEAASEQNWHELENQVSHPRCLAVGEMGLDWYRGRETEARQRDLFRRQLSLAQAHRLPVIIHNREADRELVEDLDAVQWRDPGIQHCFSSDKTFARQALDRGFWLSFAGNVTYPSAQTLREVAAWAPLDRILVETDSPYLAPQPVRGKPNQPKNAGLTARVLADLRGLPLLEFLEVIRQNFERLVGLPRPSAIGRG